MKLATYGAATPLGRVDRLAIVRGASLFDANFAYLSTLDGTCLAGRASVIADAVLPANLQLVLDNGEIAQDALRHANAQATLIEHGTAAPTGPNGERIRLSLSDVRLRSPLLRPRSIRLFSVFEEHISRRGRRTLPPVWHEFPVYWKGNPQSVIGPDDALIWPDNTTRLDFELEIAAVIGRAGMNIPAAKAMDHVFGFTIFNDVSARDIQAREMQFILGPAKGKDFCNVLGPVLVTTDEVDPYSLDVTVRVNGEEWARSSTRDMHHRWEDIIAHASKDEWLVPGDVLTTGTVTNCSGLEHTDWAEGVALLRPGDVVELEVDGIGVLRNPVGSPG